MRGSSAVLSILTDDLPDTGEGRAIDAVRRVELRGKIDAALGLSGVVAVGDWLVVGADEGQKITLLKRTAKAEIWQRERRVRLARGGSEVDIEAITFGGGYLYVLGSHSLRRRRFKPELSVRKNRKRFAELDRQALRNRLFRLRFDPDSGELGDPKTIDLSNRLRKDQFLSTFYGVPGKENGIDIEGMASRDGELHLGFRGPVLRDNYVPLMRVAFTQPKEYTLVFVRLRGQGIRDMVAVDTGFLLIAGPVNDAPGPYCLWWWDGKDQIPGRGRAVREAVLIGEVSTPGGAKAEGLALLDQTPDSADVLVVYETGTTAQAVRMSVRLPR